MNQRFTFRAVIEDPGGGGAFVRVPMNIARTFGKNKVKVKVWFDGEPYRGTMMRMGDPYHLLIVLKEIRQKIGKTYGDEIEVQLEEDLEPRIVHLPQDFKQALEQNPEAYAFYMKLSYTNQKEYVCWIEEARQPKTRQTRLASAMDLLNQGVKEP
jgi:hypothetical protein